MYRTFLHVRLNILYTGKLVLGKGGLDRWLGRLGPPGRVPGLWAGVRHAGGRTQRRAGDTWGPSGGLGTWREVVLILADVLPRVQVLLF